MFASINPIAQCRKPSGPLGWLILRLMNKRHSGVTDWGLEHVRIVKSDIILDMGCGGGRTIAKLTAMASEGRVCGIDYSAAAVAASKRTNREAVESRRVELREASVSAIPYADGEFDLVTAVETHFWWPDIPRGMREAFRVLKSGGRLVIIAEYYNGGKHEKYAEKLAEHTSMASLTVDQHRALLLDAGFADVQVIEDTARGWICAHAGRPA
jgi:SAM-dependent methyltransferase